MHSDHLSVYVRGIGVQDHPVGSGTVVGGKSRYLHAQLRTTDEVGGLVGLVRDAYVRQDQ